MSAETLKKYQNTIILSLDTNQTAVQLVKVLDASEILWVHDNTFAGSNRCYFVSMDQKRTWTYEELRSDSDGTFLLPFNSFSYPGNSKYEV
jgi:hypothetical protein